MSTLEFLPSIKDNEALTCPRCNTRQYPRDGKYLRCHCPLNTGYVVFNLENPTEACSEANHKELAGKIGRLLRSLRRRRGICQSDLARMAKGIDRSYLSKAECGRVLLRLDNLLTVLEALGLRAVILRFEATGSERFQNQAAFAGPEIHPS